MREIITLQLGQQANYLGTHYWNTQESYFTYDGQEDSPVDHDASFRAGIGTDGHDTYTPRVLIFDLKGAFGTLRRENALYQPPQPHQQQSAFTGTPIPIQLPPIAPSPYQQALESGISPPPLTPATVRFWSDYNHLFYHPRSLIQLSEYELHSSLLPFQQWSTGAELFANLDREHDLLDRDLRPWLEECDQLQALQIFSGSDDAWGGFAAALLERVADEMGKGCRWVWGLQDRAAVVTRERRISRLTNVARSLYGLREAASVLMPMMSAPQPTLMPRYLDADLGGRWQTAALQALALESITLPTRLRVGESGHAWFDELEGTLNHEGKRRVIGATMSVQDPEALADEMQVDSRAVPNGLSNDHDHEPEEAEKLDIDFFPDITYGLQSGSGSVLQRKPHVLSQVLCLRGPWPIPDDDEEAAWHHAQFRDGRPRTSLHPNQLLFPLLASYPSIFRFADRPQRLAVKAALSTSTAVAERIRQLESATRRVVGVEEREVLCDGLVTMAEEYEEGWHSGDDEDDDD